jgi:hypothetical protein
MGILASGDHDMAVRRKVLQEHGQDLIDGGKSDYVVIVQDQDERIRTCSEIIEQAGQYGMMWWRPQGVERPRCRGSQMSIYSLNSGDERGEKAGEIVVPLVQ